MTEIQLGSGSPSAATHRRTQASRTLNRHYVERPSNLAIEEAANNIPRERESDNIQAPSRPSRLVNLRLRTADLIEAQQEEIIPPEDTQVSTPIIPNVVEFGSAPADLSQVVPPEEETTETYDQPTITSYAPAVIEKSAIVSQPEPQDLAMSIAADYAAASFDASVNTTSTTSGSIDAIARAASEAIATIRTANDPSEIAEQVTSLKAFAENIKASSSAPEMAELSDTIEKFVNVAMKSTRVQEEIEKKLIEEEAAKAKAKANADLRAVIKKPAIVAKPITTSKSVTKTSNTKIAKPTKPASRIATRPTTRPRPTTTRRTTKKSAGLVADEDQALRKALRSVASMDDDPDEKTLRKKLPRRKTSKKRFALAFFCAIACVSGIVYFVGSNIPDISVKVAAIQTGIEASYPTYVPRDFSLSDISSENGKITLSFKGPDKATFTITEEKSSWDSTALLRNFVEPTWDANYITTHEQGLTIYISGANATWVNGGVLYKITAPSNSLTKKQLRNIVTSM